jgi:transcriptional regulator with XRE-family HTH domain
MEPMENIRIILAQRIKRFRKARGMSQEDLSEKSRLSIGTIKLVETQKRWPSPENMEAIATGLGITVSELFGGQAQGKDKAISEPVSVFAKKLLNIPDDAWDLIQKLGDAKSDVWVDVKSLLEEQIEHDKEAGSTTNHA